MIYNGSMFFLEQNLDQWWEITGQQMSVHSTCKLWNSGIGKAVELRKQDSLGKRTCISFFQGFVQYTYWTGKNCLWKLFRGGANRKYSCFPLNGFWGPLGQCSPLAVDTSKWFAFVSRGRIWIWAGVTDLRQKEKGAAEDVMLGWHHWLNGHGSEQPLGEGEG